MSIKRFNPTLCRGRVWGVINVARAAQRGLTWALNLTALWPVSDALVPVGLSCLGWGCVLFQES